MHTQAVTYVDSVLLFLIQVFFLLCSALLLFLFPLQSATEIILLLVQKAFLS